jgi:hypothetical protein
MQNGHIKLNNAFIFLKNGHIQLNNAFIFLKNGHCIPYEPFFPCKMDISNLITYFSGVKWALPLEECISRLEWTLPDELCIFSVQNGHGSLYYSFSAGMMDSASWERQIVACHQLICIRIVWYIKAIFH